MDGSVNVKDVKASPMDTALLYIALTLSTASFLLFVISGFEANHSIEVDQRSVSASYVWLMNESSQVARVRDGVSAACVGFTDDECVSASRGSKVGLGEAALRVRGGIQFGRHGPVFQTSHDGREMIIEQFHSETQILRVNLETGGIVVGDGLDVPQSKTVRVNGYSHEGDDRYDSEAWIASEGFDLSPVGSNRTYARVDRVCHREDGLKCGMRYMAAGPAKVAKSFVALPNTVVIGEAPSAFIDANGPKADVLVFGKAFSGMLHTPEEASTCSQMPLASQDIESGEGATSQLLKLTLESCSHPEFLLNAKIINEGQQNFRFCLGDQAFFNNTETGVSLGECHIRHGEHIIYYCKKYIVD